MYPYTRTCRSASEMYWRMADTVSVPLMARHAVYLARSAAVKFALVLLLEEGASPDTACLCHAYSSRRSRFCKKNRNTKSQTKKEYMNICESHRFRYKQTQKLSLQTSTFITSLHIGRTFFPTPRHTIASTSSSTTQLSLSRQRQSTSVGGNHTHQPIIFTTLKRCSYS